MADQEPTLGAPAAAVLDDAHQNGAEPRGIKRQRPSIDEDDDDEDKAGRERRKIEIKFITDKSRRHITFSTRKAGIMKKVRHHPRPPCAGLVLDAPAMAF